MNVTNGDFAHDTYPVEDRGSNPSNVVVHDTYLCDIVSSLDQKAFRNVNLYQRSIVSLADHEMYDH